MNETLAFFIDQLLSIGKPAPTCADEVCVLEWVQYQSQLAQRTYDTAVAAVEEGSLSPEDFGKVEELYKHTLQEITDQGLSSLGVLEV